MRKVVVLLIAFLGLNLYLPVLFSYDRTAQRIYPAMPKYQPRQAWRSLSEPLIYIRPDSKQKEEIPKPSESLQITGIVRVHNTAGGGGSGSMMSGPSIYLETAEGTYAISNPSAYYSDPLWQKLLPLKNKEVTLTAEINPISSRSGYQGSLVNVEVVEKPKYYWGGELENISMQISNPDTARDAILVRVEDDKLKLTIGTGSSAVLYALDLVSGTLSCRSIGRGDQYKPADKQYADVISLLVNNLQRMSQYAAPEKTAQVQQVINYLTNIKNQLQPQYHWGEIKEMSVETVTDTGYYHGGYSNLEKVITKVMENELSATTVNLTQHGKEESYVLDLVNGDITTPEGKEIIPDEETKYLTAINDMLFVVEKQESAGGDVEQAVDYLSNIKEELGGSKYYWSEEGLPETRFYSLEGMISFTVKDDCLSISDRENYKSYDLNLLTGVISYSGWTVAGTGNGIIPPDDPDNKQRYTKVVEDMFDMTLTTLYEGREEFDNEEKGHFLTVASYLNEILRR